MLDLVKTMTGEAMYKLCEELWPITRSITGEGVRDTLRVIQRELQNFKIHEIPTGTKVFDWEVPREWNVNEAYIENESGERIVDFKDHNLHLMGYSVPVDEIISLEELQSHLYSLEEQPKAIPYVTSYYSENWGFCLTHERRATLQAGNYHVVIDSTLKSGSMTYGEYIVPGESKEEIFFSTYICHPSMANNELSGPAVAVELAKWLSKRKNRYTYRFIFIPETIGSIAYLSRHLQEMQQNIIAGFVLTCVGDDGPYSYLASRYGDTLADKVAKNVLKFMHPDYLSYSYLERGSDERQYCSPGIDLPVVSIMRSKYATYPEYHTSLDDLTFISPEGLQGAFEVYRKCIEVLEQNNIYKVTCLCEPQLGKRGLYPSTSTKSSNDKVYNLLNLIAYADGTNDLIDISNIIKTPLWELDSIISELIDSGLLAAVNLSGVNIPKGLIQ